MGKSFLTEITIAGYKSFGSEEMSQKISLSKVNIIVGPNGVGKSNFISFFKMLNFMMTGSFQTFVGQNGFASAVMHFGPKKTPVINASLTFKNENFIDTYSFTLVRSINDSLIFSNESITSGTQTFELAGGQKESYLATEYLEHSNEKAVKTILSSCRAFQFHDTSSTANIRSYCPLSRNAYLMSDGGNVAAILYKLKNDSEKSKKYYDRIVDYVRMVVPQFDDFVLEDKNDSLLLSWREKDNPEYVLNAGQLSDGSLRFIALAVLFLQPPEVLPNVILIDEPELGLHPLAIDVLASMIKIASESCQVIVATQSARVLDDFDAEQIIVAEGENHSTVFKRLNREDLSVWLDDYSLSQLWEKNIIGGQP